MEVWRNIAEQAYCVRDAVYVSQVNRAAFTGCDEAFWKRELQLVGYSLPAEPIVIGRCRTTGTWGNLARVLLASFAHYLDICDFPDEAYLIDYCTPKIVHYRRRKATLS